ncbi:hypothetical protein T552_01755 [Pneumocystis carinii B80]|uniref:Uncharacterized protein n=1 Tax=Pneumocystis carinii (strain B80) TaxID=1408658 RepID=A0A0W4ZJF4_PNEC8|nr:hypothetical protein T552_01755 [Pneumocystis carinii B80]KTW28495.1 hypothetical protein T552_01755 [Pneumocystis carinii B80]
MPLKDEAESRGKRGNGRKSNWTVLEKTGIPLGVSPGKGSLTSKPTSFRLSKTTFSEATYVPIRGFNTVEVSSYLNKEWKSALDRANDTTFPAKDRPEIYKMTNNEWMTKNGSTASIWGGRGHLMAKGSTFLAELRKSIVSNNIVEPKGG